MEHSERNKILEKWLPWVQKTASDAFVKYDNGHCEMDDVFQEGCIAVAKSIEHDDREPFYFMKAKRDTEDFLRKQMWRKESKNLQYNDELKGKREKLCRKIDVKSAIEKLDKKEIAITIMSYWQDMSDQEIADATGIPKRTVCRKRNNALRRLHEILC